MTWAYCASSPVKHVSRVYMKSERIENRDHLISKVFIQNSSRIGFRGFTNLVLLVESASHISPLFYGELSRQLHVYILHR